MGSSVIEANELGQVISYEEYYSYGVSAYRAAAAGVDLSLKRYRFTGKERDEETGLDYFGVRYYAAWLGRWTAGDPGGFVDGLNLYRYVRNNPVNGVDADGRKTQPVEEPPPVKINSSEKDTSEYEEPNSLSGGSYYNLQGEYLGNDGKSGNKNKVFIAESVIKNDEDVVTTAENAVLLTNPDGTIVSAKYLKKMAAKIINEDSSGEDVIMAIGSAMRNQMDRKGWTVVEMIDDDDYSYASASFKSGESEATKKLGFKSAINALTNGYDYSNGAQYFDGVDFADKAPDRFKFRSGIKIHSEHFKAFGDAWPDSEVRATRGNSSAERAEIWENETYRKYGYVQLGSNSKSNKNKIKYESTATYGRKIFTKSVDIEPIKEFEKNTIIPFKKSWNNFVERNNLEGFLKKFEKIK